MQVMSTAEIHPYGQIYIQICVCALVLAHHTMHLSLMLHAAIASKRTALILK